MQIKNIPEDILKEIASGKYRDTYFIYNRKSTDEAENQRNSIDIQKNENTKFAFRHKLKLAPLTIPSLCTNGIISEKHSGFKEDDNLTFTDTGMVQYYIERPKFFKLVEFLSKGLFKGLICYSWDRISRNKVDDSIIRKLMKGGSDIRFIYANYDNSSSGALHMDIDGMFAGHHSRVTSEKVKMATWTLRNRGICTYRAPIGYLNLGTTDNKPFDQERAPVVKNIFEMYSTGDFSLSDMVRYATEQGLTTAPMRPRRTKEEILSDDGDEEIKRDKISKVITAGSIQKFLTNRFYTGKVPDSDGIWIESISHKALITEQLFEKVQSVLGKKKTSIYHTDTINYLHRGLVRCASCTRIYTPYEQKGNIYYGTRCRKDCTNTKKTFNLAFLEDKIGELISRLHFTEKELEEINLRATTDVTLLEEKRTYEIESEDRKKKKIREDIKYLRENKLSFLKSGVYSAEDYLKEEDKLNKELTKLQNSEQVSDMAMHEVVKDVVNLSELLKYGYEYYKFANSEEKAQIIRIIFSELTLSENSFNYKCKNGFISLQSRFISPCEQGGTRTPNP